MRLSPPVPGILPRQVLPGGISIDDHHFPEGIDVGTSAYAIHHHPEYFADPFSYKPERWIVHPPEVSEEAVTLAQSAFCPFSVGPRACIGRSMAYMELKIALSRTLFMYDMRLAPRTNLGEGHVDLEWGRQRVGEFQLRDTFTAAKNGPLVQFRFREGLHL